MADKNIEEINSKSLIRIVEVLQVEDNLPTEGSNEISRNSFGRRIKVRLYEDHKDLKEMNCLGCGHFYQNIYKSSLKLGKWFWCFFKA